jgi:ABC-type transport system substrate-binding protein
VKRVVVGLLLSALVASACSSATQDEVDGATTSTTVVSTDTITAQSTTPADDGEAQLLKPYGGTVVLVASGDPEEFAEVDGLVHLAVGLGWHIRRWERDKYVPGLLTEIPSFQNGLLKLNDDGTMTVRYEIHPSAVWEDGAPITGEDFEFTYEFMAANADELLAIANDLATEPPWASELSKIDPDSLVVEERAFEYTLPATRLWTGLFTVVIPKHQVGDTDISIWLDEPADWFSAGPWQGWYWSPVEVGESGMPEAIGTRNEWYWVADPETGQQTPFWDGIRRIILPDREEAWDYFLQTPEADFITHAVTGETVGDIAAHDLIVVPLGGRFEHIGFNFGPGRFEANPDSLVEHLAFRRAIAHALDRQRIADEVYGGHIDAIESYVTLFSPSHSTDAWSRYEYDPSKARQLLSDLCAELERDCVEEPPTMTFSTTGFLWRPPTAALVQEMLGEVGIQVSLDTDREGVLDVIDAGYETIMFAWNPGAAGLDPLIAIQENFGPESAFGIYSWGTDDSAIASATTERYAEIVRQLPRTFDDDEVARLINEAEQILADELVFIPLFPQGFADFWKPDRVAGPESEIIATDYPGIWEISYRTDLGEDARFEP